MLFTFPQLRAQNQVLKKAVVDEQANSTTLKVNCTKEADHFDSFTSETFNFCGSLMPKLNLEPLRVSVFRLHTFNLSNYFIQFVWINLSFNRIRFNGIHFDPFHWFQTFFNAAIWQSTHEIIGLETCHGDY